MYGTIAILEVSDGGITLIKELTLDHPLPHESQIGKGITGIAFDDSKNCIWASFSNTIVKLDLESESIIELISDPKFNDLHDLFIHEGNLVCVNSGNESIDIIDKSTKNIKRIDFLSEDLRMYAPGVTNFSSTKPHLYHISSARYNHNNELIIGFFKQQRILNIDKWTQIGTRMDSPVHDIQTIDDEVFWTTISGKVYSSTYDQPIVNLNHHYSSVGWTRGLYSTPEYFLIGITSIRESNSNFFNILTGSNLSSKNAKVILYDRENETISSEYVLPTPESRKIYSIIELKS